MKVIIIGTGNVANIIGKLCKTAAHQVIQVYGRGSEAAERLAAELDCAYCSNWNDIQKSADLYIAAISDEALAEMATFLKLPGRLIVHTAGSVSMEVLKPISPYYGILYPLQSIRKELPPASGIPFLVNGNNNEVKSRIFKLASELSPWVAETSDEERSKLHVAAVIVNNFTNHLYAMAEAFCIREALDFKLLLPLIQETADRLQRISPKQALTGPAIRKDHATINKHLEILEKYPQIKFIYEQLTSSIQHFNP